jgi:hypothetical protein
MYGQRIVDIYMKQKFSSITCSSVCLFNIYLHNYLLIMFRLGNSLNHLKFVCVSCLDLFLREYHVPVFLCMTISLSFLFATLLEERYKIYLNSRLLRNDYTY